MLKNKLKQFVSALAITSLLFTSSFAADVVKPTDSKIKMETKEDLKKYNGKKIIDILTINDFHGNLIEEKGEKGKNAGMSKIMTVVKEHKILNPNTLFVSAGDNYQGSALSNLTYGEPISEMYKDLHIIASAVGNHEFDWGFEKIEPWAKQGEFDFLASNIYDKTLNKPVSWAKPYKIVQVDGINIAFIGLTTQETPDKTKAENIKNLEFKPVKESAQEWVKFLKEGKAKEGKVDAIIALTHVGSFQDATTKEITGEVITTGLVNVEGIDAIISSHTHEVVLGKVDKMPVIQSGKYGRAMGQLRLVFDQNKKLENVELSMDNLTSRKNQIKEDPKGIEILNKYNEKISPMTSEIVGYTAIDLTHERFTDKVSPLGEKVCKFMADSADVEIGIANGGGIRVPIDQGVITMGKLWEMLPFDNFLVTMDLKGSTIKGLLEHGIANKEFGMIEYSGLVVDYDATKEKGSKVKSIKLLNGQDLDMNKTYKIVTNDFMLNIDNYAKGGDGYSFEGATNVEVVKDDMREAIKKGFQKELNSNDIYKKKVEEFKKAQEIEKQKESQDKLNQKKTA